MLETYVTRLLYQKHMLRENHDYIGMTKSCLNQAINWEIKLPTYKVCRWVR